MTDKATKAEAQYRDYPNGIQFCGACSMFVQPVDCTAVEGHISSRGWCKFFKRKEGEK